MFFSVMLSDTKIEYARQTSMSVLHLPVRTEAHVTIWSTDINVTVVNTTRVPSKS